MSTSNLLSLAGWTFLPNVSATVEMGKLPAKFKKIY